MSDTVFARILGWSDSKERVASVLYRAIVAQARQPALYADFAVPDTVDGRFEMVVLHSVLLHHRLRRDDEPGRALSQKVFDVFVDDMDRSLREMGIGDLGVPKRMKTIGRSFYGRLGSYGRALAEGDSGALALALQRNLFPEDRGADTVRLAAYVLAAASQLGRQAFATIAEGVLAFPTAAEIAGARPVQ